MAYLSLVVVLAAASQVMGHSILPPDNPDPSHPSQPQSQCRYLPGDAGWPDDAAWHHLNQTVEGRLIRGTPLGRPCHSPYLDDARCAKIQRDWSLIPPFIHDPVNVVSPYWVNTSCSPFTSPDTPCELGNLAPYALRVSKAADVVAGLRFARAHNVRLTIKNTGHDFLGRSAGAGSLALWTHHLKDITFFDNYSRDSGGDGEGSGGYAGPAVRLGAGVEYADVYPAASARGLRVVGGSCPSVGIAGGFTQGGGHGPLGSAYGLGADQALEWEVVTAAGEHLTASPTQNADLFWALSGGGPGNYAVVLSVTVRAYKDGPVAGAGFGFANAGGDDDARYWDAVTAWLRYLPVLDRIPGLTTVWSFSARAFELTFATWPDATSAAQIDDALAPLLDQLARRNVSLGASYASTLYPSYAQHYERWAFQDYSKDVALGGRLIPRSVVADEAAGLPSLIANFRRVSEGGAQTFFVAGNFSSRGGRPANAVLPAWRDALAVTAFSRTVPAGATWDEIRASQAQANAWQGGLRAATPGGGSYMNEATWDDPHWKEDYFGANYGGLLAVKESYDPTHVFWANAAVGSDRYWRAGANQRLCRVE